MPGLKWSGAEVAGKKYISTLRFTQNNPGNFETPTAYKSWSYEASETPGYLNSVQTSAPTHSRMTDRYRTTGPVPLNAGDYWASGYEFNPGTLTDVQEVIRLADSRVRARIQSSQYSDFNLATFLGEAGEAIEQIGDTAKRLARMGRELKRGNLKNALDAISQSVNRRHRRHPLSPTEVRNNASQLFLEYKWGWVPLLSDVKASAEKVAHTLLDRPDIFEESATARRQRVTTDFLSELGGTTPRVTSEEISCRVKLRFSVSNHALALAASLGLTNPLAVAWELAPFSCVADWFYPVGTLLGQIGQLDGLQFAGGTQTLKGRRTYMHAASNVQTITYPGWVDGKWSTAALVETVQNGSYVTKEFGFRRSLLTQFPRPSFPPVGGGVNSVDRCLLSLSLMQQIFGSK